MKIIIQYFDDEKEADETEWFGDAIAQATSWEEAHDKLKHLKNGYTVPIDKSKTTTLQDLHSKLQGGRKAQYRKTYYAKNPWMRHLNNSRARAKQRGRENTLTVEQIKQLWHRDKAWELKQPSIDRINNDEGYYFENCRFIELKLNCYLGSIGEKMLPESNIKLSKAMRGNRNAVGKPKKHYRSRVRFPFIQEKMSEQQLTARSLSTRSGVHYTTICRLLNGQTEPTKRTLDKLNKALLETKDTN